METRPHVSPHTGQRVYSEASLKNVAEEHYAKVSPRRSFYPQFGPKVQAVSLSLTPPTLPVSHSQRSWSPGVPLRTMLGQACSRERRLRGAE